MIVVSITGGIVVTAAKAWDPFHITYLSIIDGLPDPSNIYKEFVNAAFKGRIKG